jgi:hypothetical protein
MGSRPTFQKPSPKGKRNTMTTKKTIAQEAAEQEAAAPAPSFFGTFAEVDSVVGKTDLINLKFDKDDEYVFRILDSAPFVVGQHWNIPQSAKGKGAAKCRKNYNPVPGVPFTKEFVAAQACPWCEMEAEFGDKAMGDKKGFYNLSFAYISNVIHDGQIKIWEASQRSILKQMAAMQTSKAWAEYFGKNGVTDLEMIVTKKTEKGKVSYSVGALPKSQPLSDESLAEWREKRIDLEKVKAPRLDEESLAEDLQNYPKPRDTDKPTHFS